MSLDWERNQLDPFTEPPNTTKELITCSRCTRRRWKEDLVRVGDRYYCRGSCYDAPVGQGRLRRGDE